MCPEAHGPPLEFCQPRGLTLFSMKCRSRRLVWVFFSPREGGEERLFCSTVSCLTELCSRPVRAEPFPSHSPGPMSSSSGLYGGLQDGEGLCASCVHGGACQDPLCSCLR